MQTITPFLWFDHQAEEAANFYVSVFSGRRGAAPDGSKVLNVSRYGEAGPAPAGTVMTAQFQLDGQEFTALNGGPAHAFTEAISFLVSCETQDEVDDYWAKLLEGGAAQQCGWLTDKFGVSWQIVPTILPELMQDKDAEKVKRVTQAMMQMVKLDIKGLKRAAEQA